MNLIPFDLLSLEKDAYIPLITDKFVRTIPSLRALQIESGDAVTGDNDRIGLFAVGNPIYTGLSTTSAPTNDNLGL